TNWVLKKTNLIIDLETRNSEDLLSIEKSFQSGGQTLYTNCTEIDSILLPLIYYKNSMNQVPSADDSRLVFFSNRRLFCNPQFHMYFETSIPLDSFSPNTLTCTTPISYSSSVENLIDQFQLSLFENLFPEEYNKRKILLDCMNECTDKLKQVDDLLKTQWKKDGFGDDKILLTKLALQRKYKIGEVLDYCQDYLSTINELMKILAPLAIRASLLMTLSLKMKLISKNYEFSINIIEYIIMSLATLVKSFKKEFNLKTQLKIDDIQVNEEANESQIK
ncbi:dynein heavy chain axonemal-like, partial [Brachionus plicatilis]